MSLHDKITTIRKGLGRHASSFERARARRAELAPFTTPADILTAIHHSSSLTDEERFARVGALVAAHGEDTASASWSSILTVAFEPFLLKLRVALRRPENEDLDQRVLLAFLHALARPGVQRAGTSALIAIERATRSALVRQREARREARSEGESVPFDDDVHGHGGFSAVALAEARVEASWAARRGAQAVAHLRPSPRKDGAGGERSERAA